jgi:hypothetical protein
MATPQTGWADEFVKKLAKIVPDQFFLSKLAHKISTYRGKSSPQNLGYFCISRKAVQSKQSPKCRKFAENSPKIRPIWSP